jgi:two-component system sensor histidine kinase VicK
MDFHPEPVDLELLLHEVSESVDSLTLAKHATLELSVAPECIDIELDPDKLRQVLRNALSNALQLTAEGGSVQLHARLEAATDQLRFDIRGQHKLDAQTTLRQADGGLGLTLAQRMVEQQGGRAGVSHELGQGSNYFVLLPRKSTINPSPSLGAT